MSMEIDTPQQVDRVNKKQKTTTNFTPIKSLPISRVVIYKNGVAYFERQGEIEGDCSVELSFKASEMNDVLRSLSVRGGKISNISYDASSNEGDVLSPPPFPGSNNVNNSLQGANVHIVKNDERIIDGRVIGYQTRNAPVHEEVMQLLVDDSTIVYVPTSAIASIKVLDTHVSGRIKELLDKELNSKKDTKNVTINITGKGSRVVQVSYMLENPIWKSNYRISMIGETSKTKTDTKIKTFKLEGWACVDNISEDEWKDVSLTLVSGSPISFQYEVYNPIIGIRPAEYSDEGKSAQKVHQVQNKLNRAQQPGPSSQPYSAYGQMQQQQLQQQQQIPRVQTRNINMNMNNMMYQQNQFSAPEYDSPVGDVESQVVEIGNLFHYEIQNLISVKANQAALVPTVSGDFTGRKICWFNPRRHTLNPLQSVYLKNTLGTLLDKGPIMVTEDNNYLGECIFDNILLQDEEKIIPYSVNLECKVTSTSQTKETPSKTTIKSGSMHIGKISLHTTRYVLVNLSEHEIELVLDHPDTCMEPVEGVRTLKLKESTRYFNTVKPMNQAAPTILPASKKTEIVSYNGRIGQLSRATIAEWYVQQCLSEPAFLALVQVYDGAKRVSEMREALVEGKATEERIIADQKRVQQLIYNSGGSAQTFTQQVADLEKQLAALRATHEQNLVKWKKERLNQLQAVEGLKYEIDLQNSPPLKAGATEEEQQRIPSYSRTIIDDLLKATL